MTQAQAPQGADRDGPSLRQANAHQTASNRSREVFFF